MAAIIGTSGYSYEDWRGSFYPADLGKEDFLRFYAMFFHFVELDFSYYRMPDARGLIRMAESVPSDFLFSLKVHRSLTHEGGADWPARAGEFLAAVGARPFRDKLAAVLLQFPFGFRYTDPNRVYLGELTEALAGLPLVLEFRNAEWQRQSVTEEAARRSLAIAAVDVPALDGLPRPGGDGTTFGSPGFDAAASGGRSGLSYLRFHGRNAAAWWDGDAAGRYSWLYSDAELEEWRPRVLQEEGRAKTLLVAFNNHQGGNAVRNARRFKELLDEGRPRLSLGE